MSNLPTPNPPRLRSPKKGGWGYFCREIRRRFLGAWGNPVFFQYFFGVVFLLAGVGIWITWIRYSLTTFSDDTAKQLAVRGILEASTTYAVAISATALADIFLAGQRTNSGDSTQVIPRSFFIFCFTLTGIVVASLAVSFFLPMYTMPIVGAVVSVVVCLFQWWIINADNPALADDDDPSQLTGGDPLGDLSGNLNGYTT